MGNDFNISFGTNRTQISNKDFRVGMNLSELNTICEGDKGAVSIFNQFDTNKDGKLDKDEIETIKNTLYETSGTDGVADDFSEKDFKNFKKQMGMKKGNWQDMMLVLYSIKTLSKIMDRKDIKNNPNKFGFGEDENGTYSKKKLENGEYLIEYDSGNRYICNKNGTKLEEIKDGKKLYKLDPIYEWDADLKMYKDPDGNILGGLYDDNSMLINGKLNETFEQALDRLGLTAEEKLEVIKVNRDVSLDQVLYTQDSPDECTYQRIVLPSNIVSKFDNADILIPLKPNLENNN